MYMGALCQILHVHTSNSKRLYDEDEFSVLSL